MYLVPLEVISTTADSVDAAPGALLVPESTAVVHCTVVIEVTVDPRVVVTVIRREHHVILEVECIITDVTRVARHEQLVVTRLPVHHEQTVLGVVPGEITQLEVKSQLVGAA